MCFCLPSDLDRVKRTNKSENVMSMKLQEPEWNNQLSNCNNKHVSDEKQKHARSQSSIFADQPTNFLVQILWLCLLFFSAPSKLDWQYDVNEGVLEIVECIIDGVM